jgi:hypothetical protein
MSSTNLSTHFIAQDRERSLKRRIQNSWWDFLEQNGQYCCWVIIRAQWGCFSRMVLPASVFYRAIQTVHPHSRSYYLHCYLQWRCTSLCGVRPPHGIENAYSVAHQWPLTHSLFIHLNCSCLRFLFLIIFVIIPLWVLMISKRAYTHPQSSKLLHFAKTHTSYRECWPY